jgi:hypothetical protein
MTDSFLHQKKCKASTNFTPQNSFSILHKKFKRKKSTNVSSFMYKTGTVEKSPACYYIRNNVLEDGTSNHVKHISKIHRTRDPILLLIKVGVQDCTGCFLMNLTRWRLYASPWPAHRWLRSARKFYRRLSMPITFGMKGSFYLCLQITWSVANAIPLHVNIFRN